MVLNRPPCDRCIKAKVACVKWGKAGGCEKCSGMKARCSRVQHGKQEMASRLQEAKETRATRNSVTVDGGATENSLLEEVKGLRAEIKEMAQGADRMAGGMDRMAGGMDRMAGSMDRMAGSFDKMTGLMAVWLKRESHTADYEANERIERMEETLDEYMVAGGSGELGESGEQSGMPPADVPDLMDL